MLLRKHLDDRDKNGLHYMQTSYLCLFGSAGTSVYLVDCSICMFARIKFDKIALPMV